MKYASGEEAQVGDVVECVNAPGDSPNWPVHGREYVVNDFYFNSDVRLDGVKMSWCANRFRLVRRANVQHKYPRSGKNKINGATYFVDEPGGDLYFYDRRTGEKSKSSFGTECELFGKDFFTETFDHHDKPKYPRYATWCGCEYVINKPGERPWLVLSCGLQPSSNHKTEAELFASPATKEVFKDAASKEIPWAKHEVSYAYDVPPFDSFEGFGETIEAFNKRRDAAELSLRSAGFTYVEGASMWKPPVGGSSEQGKRIRELQEDLASVEDRYLQALACVDQAFQDGAQAEPAILPDYALVGSDKFKAVPRLARDYKELLESAEELRKEVELWKGRARKLFDRECDTGNKELVEISELLEVPGEDWFEDSDYEMYEEADIVGAVRELQAANRSLREELGRAKQEGREKLRKVLTQPMGGYKSISELVDSTLEQDPRFKFQLHDWAKAAKPVLDEALERDHWPK